MADSGADGAPDPGRTVRNVRPRDRLGRPLPYGSAGVPSQPTGVFRTPDETLAAAQQLLDTGLSFQAHEVLEDAWKAAPEAERDLWRGLAQLAVGVTHAARGNARGAVALLRRGASLIAGFRDLYGLDIGRLLEWTDRAVTEVQDRGAITRQLPLRPDSGAPPR